jgi:WD40 repeat protein
MLVWPTAGYRLASNGVPLIVRADHAERRPASGSTTDRQAQSGATMETRTLLSFAVVAALAVRGAYAAELLAVAVSRDHAAIAAGGKSGKVCVWDARNGQRLHVITAMAAVHGLAFVKDAKTLLVGTDDAGLELWTDGPIDWKRARVFGRADSLYSLAVSPEGNELAVSQNTGWLYLYDTRTWQETGVLFQRSNFLSAVAFAPDGKSLATAGAGFDVWNYDAHSALRKPRGKRPVEEIESASRASLRWSANGGEPLIDPYSVDIAFSPDYKSAAGVDGVGRLNSGGRDLYVWDAHNGHRMWSARGMGMLCVAFTADGKTIVTGSDDGVMRAWDAATGMLRMTWTGHGKAVRQLAVLHDGAFASVGDDGDAILWNAPGKESVRLHAD